MGRKRATRIAMCRLGAHEFTLGAALVAGCLTLAGCETLPGFGTQPDAQPVVQEPLLRGPPPPPARPRGASSVAARFRSDILPPAPGAPVAEVLAAPPPPVPRGAMPPTVGAEAVATTAPTPPPVAPTPPPVAPTPPQLLGDSVASDAARAEPAAPPSIEPATLVGATATMLRDRFGGPESQNPIASGVSWHYDRAACKASFVLLPELNSGALRVFSYEITPREGAMLGPAGCLGRIAATRAAHAAETVR